MTRNLTPSGSISDAERKRSSTPIRTRPYAPASSRSRGSSTITGTEAISARRSPQSCTGILITLGSLSKIMDPEPKRCGPATYPAPRAAGTTSFRPSGRQVPAVGPTGQDLPSITESDREPTTALSFPRRGEGAQHRWVKTELESLATALYVKTD